MTTNGRIVGIGLERFIVELTELESQIPRCLESGHLYSEGALLFVVAVRLHVWSRNLCWNIIQ